MAMDSYGQISEYFCLRQQPALQLLHAPCSHAASKRVSGRSRCHGLNMIMPRNCVMESACELNGPTSWCLETHTVLLQVSKNASFSARSWTPRWPSVSVSVSNQKLKVLVSSRDLEKISEGLCLIPVSDRNVSFTRRAPCSQSMPISMVLTISVCYCITAYCYRVAYLLAVFCFVLLLFTVFICMYVFLFFLLPLVWWIKIYIQYTAVRWNVLIASIFVTQI